MTQPASFGEPPAGPGLCANCGKERDDHFPCVCGVMTCTNGPCEKPYDSEFEERDEQWYADRRDSQKQDV